MFIVIYNIAQYLYFCAVIKMVFFYVYYYI